MQKSTLAATFPTNPSVGHNLEIFWPFDNTYYPDVIGEEQNAIHTVVYDDGSIETLSF